MINGITYYRLKSPYEGDVTKNCGLEGTEIDNNFYVLESRDVKSVSVEDDDIVLTLYDGSTISAEDALSGYAKDLSFEFDAENGVLVITQNGEVTEIPGFAPNDFTIATDNTLVGNGTKENPLGVAKNQGTGHYKPAISFIDLTVDENGLDNIVNPHIGDRYVIKETVDLNGLLYDYKAVKSIACELLQSNSEWRIPKKEDWDTLLNSIEPDKSYANHGLNGGGLWQGKYAGKLLKSTSDGDCGWNECEGQESGCAQNCNGCGDDNNENNINPCVTHDCGHEHVDQTGVSTTPTVGANLYGFNVEPVGFINDIGEYGGFGQRTYFWTGWKNDHEAFVKGFDACRNEVNQNIVPLDYFMSLRLVKDYDGSNYYGQENVLGQSFETVLIPSANTIWTASNVAVPRCGCHAVAPDVPEECKAEETVYYIIEWDGNNWVYQKLENCEIVTIENVSDEECCIDYKLVNGELVENGQISQSDIEAIEALIKEEADAREEADNNINDSISGINDTISTLQESLATANETIAELQSQVDELEGELDDANSTITNLTQIIIGNSEYTSNKSIAERLAFIERLLTDDESGELTTLDFNDWQADGDKENDGWQNP